MLPIDLKHYKADRDAFQIIPESLAFLGLIALAVLFLIMAPYL